jgi:putative transposase
MELYHVGKKNRKELSRYQIELNEAYILAKNGLLSLSITVGLKVLNAMMSEEVEEKAGKKGKHNKDRNAYRHGTEQTSVVLGGQKAKIVKPRLRSKDNQEVPIEILKHFQSEDALDFTVLKHILTGVSTRDYEGLQDEASDTFGAKKSTVSRRFIKESSKNMNVFLNRRIDDDSYPVMMIDGVGFGDYLVIVALGIKSDGTKKVLGIREGSTENSEVCKSLISSLIERGLSVDFPRLFVLYGSKALSKAVKDVFGKDAAIQRCQIHKKRNVESHLPESEPSVASEMEAAYAEFDYKAAKVRLDAVAKRIEYKYPSAAESIREGLEETLTLHSLGTPGLLRISLSSTNPIESALSTARKTTGRVKHWQSGIQVLRWLSCGFMGAEKKFRKINGYKLIPVLINALQRKESSTSSIAG